jgi:hypothetical protein
MYIYIFDILNIYIYIYLIYHIYIIYIYVIYINIFEIHRCPYRSAMYVPFPWGLSSSQTVGFFWNLSGVCQDKSAVVMIHLFRKLQISEYIHVDICIYIYIDASGLDIPTASNSIFLLKIPSTPFWPGKDSSPDETVAANVQWLRVQYSKDGLAYRVLDDPGFSPSLLVNPQLQKGFFG